MVTKQVGALLLAAHSDVAPSGPEWLEFIDGIRSAPSLAGIAVVTEGGAPTILQRREFSALMKRRTAVPIAILTQSQTARLVVTGIAWMIGARIAAFAPDAYDDASRHLEVDGWTGARLAEQFDLLRAEVSS